MIITNIKNPRFVTYYNQLTSDEVDNMVHETSTYTAFKLKIKQRHFESEIGEIDFLIRDKTNNLKYILVYCYMEQPEEINSIEYYINDTVKLPSKEIVKVGPLMDVEVSDLLVKDLLHNYISKNYKII